MAYAYRNKKTGEVIYLNRRAKSAFWEEVEPEQEETFEEETFEEETSEKETSEKETSEENPEQEEVPKKNGRRGKK